jgi:hypothetical protein
MLLEAIRVALLTDQVVYLEGPPGWGKSALCKMLASVYGVRLFLVYLAQRAGNEIHGLPVVARESLQLDDRTYTVVEQAPPRYAVEARHTPQGSLIFMDELNQLDPQAMGQVMSIISERLVGDVPLPRESIALIAAGNPPEMSAGGWRMPLPMRRRLVKLTMEVDAPAFCDPGCFPNNWGYPLGTVQKFGHVLDAETRYRKRTLLAAWVHAQPDCFVIKDVAKMHDGFVSPATLEMAADLLAGVDQYVDKKDQGIVRQMLLRGVLGPVAADAVTVYLDNLDVPDARLVLDAPGVLLNKPLLPPDKLYYFLMSMVEEQRFRTGAAAGKDAGPILKRAQQSWYNALEVVAGLQVQGVPTDLLCMALGNLQNPEVKPRKVVPPPVVDKLAPLLTTLRTAGVNWVRLHKLKPGETV